MNKHLAETFYGYQYTPADSLMFSAFLYSYKNSIYNNKISFSKVPLFTPVAFARRAFDYLF
jgi:hypothetical protein